MVEVLYGYHPVKEALRAGKRVLLEIYLPAGKSSPRFEEVATLAAAARVSINWVPMARISVMADTDAHQGICASVGPYVWNDFSQLLKTVPVSYTHLRAHETKTRISVCGVWF